jgi:NAD(P)-dependent dehydrogenase (short-subunit alcohol dehydrogenase family)
MGDRLKDKVALVSGAGSSGPGWGNGKATAVLFAREGARVLAVDINLDAAVETKRIIETEGGICEAVAGNVSRADDVAAMVDTCLAAFGRIDVLQSTCFTTMSVLSRSAARSRPARRAGTGSTTST